MNEHTLTTFLQWLDSHLNFEKTPKKDIFWLDNMRTCCEKLGHPETSTPCFHVAGSKGKGSVSTLIAGILTAAGNKTGLYTSPHLVDFRERIATLSGFLTDTVYEKAAEQLMSCVGGQSATWFELVTLFAFLCFRETGMDYAVYEVGLGGRLDATNVVTPLVSCICEIEKEHTEYLGDTVEKIAAEKAGIIKPGIPVIIAPQSSQSIKDVFKTIAQDRNAPIVFADETADIPSITYGPNGMHVVLESPVFKRSVQADLHLLGDFQAQNALVAALAVKTAFPDFEESDIEKGLSSVTMPARFEMRKETDDLPPMVLDGAHTVNSIKATITTFARTHGTAKPVLLFACAADKDVEDIARLFAGFASKAIITKPGTAKASDIPRAQKAFEAAGIDFRITEDFSAAIPQACREAKERRLPLLVTGSFYLIAEVKKQLETTTQR